MIRIGAKGRSLLFFSLWGLIGGMGCGGPVDRVESPAPDRLLYSSRLPFRVAEREVEGCRKVTGDSTLLKCTAIDYDIGWGDTVRIWWLEYPTPLSAWKSELNGLDSASFSADRFRILLRPPVGMTFPSGAFRDLRSQWPSGSLDGAPLLTRFPVREADRGGEGVQSGYLLGQPIEGEWVCRSYRQEAFYWCWSVTAVSEQSFASWRLRFPLVETGDREWSMIREGRVVRIAERGGEIGVLSGALSPDTMRIVLKNFISLQAWAK